MAAKRLLLLLLVMYPLVTPRLVDVALVNVAFVEVRLVMKAVAAGRRVAKKEEEVALVTVLFTPARLLA